MLVVDTSTPAVTAATVEVPGDPDPAGAGPDVGRPADLEPPAGRAVGEGARRCADILGLPHAAEGSAALELLYPPAWALAALAADRVRGRTPTGRLVPLYLRRPDAVEPAARKPALR